MDPRTQTAHAWQSQTSELIYKSRLNASCPNPMYSHISSRMWNPYVGYVIIILVLGFINLEWNVDVLWYDECLRKNLLMRGLVWFAKKTFSRSCQTVSNFLPLVRPPPVFRPPSRFLCAQKSSQCFEKGRKWIFRRVSARPSVSWTDGRTNYTCRIRTRRRALWSMM